MNMDWNKPKSCFYCRQTPARHEYFVPGIPESDVKVSLCSECNEEALNGGGLTREVDDKLRKMESERHPVNAQRAARLAKLKENNPS